MEDYIKCELSDGGSPRHINTAREDYIKCELSNGGSA